MAVSQNYVRSSFPLTRILVRFRDADGDRSRFGAGGLGRVTETTVCVMRLQGVAAGTTGPVVLSRTNVGNTEAAFDALREGKRVHVVGGIEDLAIELEGAVALSEGRLGDVLHEALRRFPTWQEYRDEAEQMGNPHMLRMVEAVKEGGY